MKSLFANVLLASLMVFAVACGKDAKKKKNNNWYGYYNPYTGGQVVSGQNAKNNLTSYLNAVETKNVFQAVVIYKKRYSCSTKDFLGIDFLPITKCSESSLPMEQKYVTNGQTRIVANPALGTLLSPANGYTLGNVYQQGQYIFVDHVSANGYDTLQYTIDTARHAAVNPIQVKDTALQRIDYVYSSNI